MILRFRVWAACGPDAALRFLDGTARWSTLSLRTWQFLEFIDWKTRAARSVSCKFIFLFVDKMNLPHMGCLRAHLGFSAPVKISWNLPDFYFLKLVSTSDEFYVFAFLNGSRASVVLKYFWNEILKISKMSRPHAVLPLVWTRPDAAKCGPPRVFFAKAASRAASGPHAKNRSKFQIPKDVSNF